MEVLPIRQIISDDIEGIRFGDVLKERLEDERYSKFYFAVAFLRRSGFDYIGEPLTEFLDRDGKIFGIAGVDNKITTREALEQLNEIAVCSTIFNTTSDIIFHPKFYALEGQNDAALIIGSGNMTRNGLFRNVEFGTVIEFDLTNESEAEKFSDYRLFFDTLLNDRHPNVQSISEDVLDLLEDDGTLLTEEEARSSRASGSESSEDASESEVSDEVRELFPTQNTPSLPSSSRITIKDSTVESGVSFVEGDTFVIQLSKFDSRQPNDPGTKRVLIPKDAIDFFPKMTEGPNKYPDVYFNVELQTEEGSETLEYRFWHYDKKGEWRLVVGDDTMEQVSAEGGSLLVVSKDASDFHVEVVNQDDEDFEKFLEACTEKVGEKVWGFID